MRLKQGYLVTSIDLESFHFINQFVLNREGEVNRLKVEVTRLERNLPATVRKY